MKKKGLFFLYGTLFVIISLIILVILTVKKTPHTTITRIPIPTPIAIGAAQQKQVQDLQPGSSTIQNVKTIYGNPVKTFLKNGYMENDYHLPNTIRQDKIYTKNNVVQYISQEQLSNNSLYTDFVNKSKKQPSGVLYDPKGYGGDIHWYVFNQDGIAFFADKKSGYTFQTIKFSPMSYQDFIKNVAPLFSLVQTEPEEVKVDGNNPQNQ